MIITMIITMIFIANLQLKEENFYKFQIKILNKKL